MHTKVFVTNLLLSSTLLLSLQACKQVPNQSPTQTENASQQPSEVSDLSEAETLNATAPVIPGDVIVQLFNWRFVQITAEIDSLAANGYAQIHVSPPNLTIASNQWWGRYQPVDYRLIAGPLGNETEFKAMIAKAHSKGLKIIVDMVLNHTYNPTSPLPTETAKLNSSLGALFKPTDFHAAFCITNYNDPVMVRNGRMCGGGSDPGMPDLDQNSANVLKVQREFLTRLNAMGVDGYRFDAVKHMEVTYFAKLFAGDLVKNKLIFGEVIADSATYTRDMAPYVNGTTMRFYDFPFRQTLQSAFQYGGSLATLVDGALVTNKKALADNRAVGFVMNHDIPTNGAFSGMITDVKSEELSYAFILGSGRVGIPYVYSDLGLANNAGLTTDRWKNAHRNGKTISMVKWHNAMMGQAPTTLSTAPCFVVIQRGTKGLMGINKCTTNATITLPAAFVTAMKSVKNFETNVTTTFDSTRRLILPPQSAQFFVKP